MRLVASLLPLLLLLPYCTPFLPLPPLRTGALSTLGFNSFSPIAVQPRAGRGRTLYASNSAKKAKRIVGLKRQKIRQLAKKQKEEMAAKKVVLVPSDTLTQPSRSPNLLTTLLQQAIQAEDYSLAASLRDELSQATATPPGLLEWPTPPLPSWLAARLLALENPSYPFPTPLQSTLLATLHTTQTPATATSTSTTLIHAPPGTGKTLSYYLTTLPQITPSLLTRVQNRPPPPATPLLLILVPTTALAIQSSLLAYTLLGGTVRPPTGSEYTPGSTQNMFKYTGPRNVKITCHLNPGDPLPTTVDILIVTKSALPSLDPSVFKDVISVVVDEPMVTLPCYLPKARFYTITGSAIPTELPSILPAPVVNVKVAYAGTQNQAHNVCLSTQPVLSLVRFLRGEGGRAVVFFEDVRALKEAVGMVRDGVWGSRKLGVLIPVENGGIDPGRAVDDFKNGVSDLLLCSEASGRGVDFVDVEKVYIMFECQKEGNNYEQVSGRCGRVGQGAGRVFSIGDESVVDSVKGTGREMGFEVAEVEEPGGGMEDAMEKIRRYGVENWGEGKGGDGLDVEAVRRYLDDLSNL